MRLHGIRKDSAPQEEHGDEGKADPNHPNCPNEVWSYGEETCGILSELILLRDRLKPYIMEQMKTAETTGIPPMRPVFVDYSSDKNAWDVEDQFLFGPDILVCPVVEEGQRSRKVYLPKGTSWKDAWTGQEYAGGTVIEDAPAPIEHIPVYLKAGSSVSLAQ